MRADLNDYVYFAEVVAHGGFAAGRALRQPKSKLSRRIAGLEARLGVRLIERSSRRFRVTEVGQSSMSAAAPCCSKPNKRKP
jgi:DNA-binding transcriptional LysR family regulator